MANDRSHKSSSKGDGRDSGGFIALPWSVMDCPAFHSLSHPAKALLLEFARQHHFHKGEKMHTNGRLLANSKTLSKRGWHSNGTIFRAKNELISAGFIHETVRGHRPNKASWYALTWYALPMRPSYDSGALAGFIKSAYLKIDALKPSQGVERSLIAPSKSVERSSTTPSKGAVMPTLTHSSTPSKGDHIRALPSTYETSKQVTQLNKLHQGLTS